MTTNLYQATYDVMMQCDADTKCASTHRLCKQWQAGELDIKRSPKPPELREAGRPDTPVLVAPTDVKKRGTSSQMGRTLLMHAIAHIEFNAINLALDAVYRFRCQPALYYTDWLNVADDEARHFHMICAYLHDNDCLYGDYPAHNGLWDMALLTQHDILARLALVPRVLEARGLDVTPTMIKKLQAAGDQQAADILTVIYRDEIAHVEIGSRWFNYHCNIQGLEAETTFAALIAQFPQGSLRGPFNHEARILAGFSHKELKILNDTYA